MSQPSGIANLEPLARRKEQRSWYFYDWANSAFITTVAGVLFGPYIIAIAEEAAVNDRISVLGLSVAPGALPSYTITASTLISAVLLPLLGAHRGPHVAQEGPAGRFRVGGRRSGGAAVLHDR